LWKKNFDKKQLITLLIFTLFGGMTLYFHNPIFIKWKPTVIFWIFGMILLCSQFIGKKPLVQRMLENRLEEHDSFSKTIWKKINIAWATFFILLGGVNLFIAYHFNTNVWVNFKFYGILSLLLTFSFFQAIYLSRYIKK